MNVSFPQRWNQRLSEQEALALAKRAPLHQLARAAHERARELNQQRIAYLIDRNINYTNVCTARCHFCAFYRPQGHKQGYDLSYHEIDAKILETLTLGGHRILMQGGLHPEHTVETYEGLVEHISTHHPIHIHAFSPPEIHHVASKSGLSYREVLRRLKARGLATMPGGGAEILVDRVRDQLMVGKCSSQIWLDIMQIAHEEGIHTTATMMLGHIESWEDRLEHLRQLREVQDRTGGFLSFIPWTFQPEHTPMHPRSQRWAHVRLMGAYEYLRFLAVSRLYLDNFQHIQVSMLTQGSKVAQLGLHFGADDLGSLLIEENVVRLAGCDQEGWRLNSKARPVQIPTLGTSAAEKLEREKANLTKLIEQAGFIPYERDTYYKEVFGLKVA